MTSRSESTDVSRSTGDRAISRSAASATADKLTLARLLTMVAGVSFGLWLFAPRELDAAESDFWRALASATLIGLSLAGGVFVLGRLRRGRRLGIGGLHALTLCLGVLLLLPPALVEQIVRGEGMGGPAVCLFYVLPLVSTWFLLAALLSRHVRRRYFRREARWSERFGFYLAALWTPLGIWILVDFYINAFS